MFTASYPANFIPEGDGKGFHVRFTDLPEALTGGDDIEDTVVQASDCLAEAIAGRIFRGDEIPPPSKAKRGQRLVNVPLYLAPKLALYMAMREHRIANTQLARRLGVSETVVRRMLDPKHDTKPAGTGRNCPAAFCSGSRRLLAAMNLGERGHTH